jgi:hypothetical protein
MDEVSYCCGCSYEESTITDCCAMEMHKIHEICPSCNKQADCTGYICNECGNWFKYPEEIIEYVERMKENAILDKWEAERDERT